jgi:hypothetical protein
MSGEKSSSKTINIQFTRNQTILTPEGNQKLSLRSYSNWAHCSKCGKAGYTRTEQKCNYANCVCSVFCSIPWCIYMSLKKKDLACYDTDHCCVHCNDSIASYKACEDF